MNHLNNGSVEAATYQQNLEQIRNDVRLTLEQVMGDSSPEMLDEMSSIFLEDAIPMINQIKDGIENQDSTAIKMAAHALKGSSATIGLKQFANTCLAIENASHEKNDALLRQSMVILETEYLQVHKALSTFLI